MFPIIPYKKVRVYDGKCHNHTLQTNTQHREEEAMNNNSQMTSRRQYKFSDQLPLFPSDRKRHKVLHKKTRTYHNPHKV